MTTPANPPTPVQAQILALLGTIGAKVDQGLTLLRQLNTKADLIMTAADDIAAAVAAIGSENAAIANAVSVLGTAVTGLQAGEQAILAEIANLQSQGVDVTALNAAVAQMNPAPLAEALTALTTEVQNVQNIAPATP